MAASLLNPSALQILETQNQYVPDEGPKTVPLLLLFTDPTTGEFDLDLQNFQALGKISMVQSIFIDMSQASAALTVQIADGFQNVVAKANTQGYYSVLCPNPVRMKITGTPNMGKVTLILINVPVPGSVWPTT